jgi:RNA polymerase sigma-70 factor, ECF subfamily
MPRLQQFGHKSLDLRNSGLARHKLLLVSPEFLSDAGLVPANADLECIVKEFYAPLYRFAFALTRSEAIAADLTQETFLILTRQQAHIRDLTKVKSWLFTTLRREFLRGLRSKTSHPEVELKPEHQEQLVVESAAVQSIDAITILEALAQIDESYRTVLELFYLSDLSYKEIAATLDIPIGTVMSRLSRGKEQLKGTLAKAASPNKTFKSGTEENPKR